MIFIIENSNSIFFVGKKVVFSVVKVINNSKCYRKW